MFICPFRFATHLGYYTSLQYGDEVVDRSEDESSKTGEGVGPVGKRIVGDKRKNVGLSQAIDALLSLSGQIHQLMPLTSRRLKFTSIVFLAAKAGSSVLLPASEKALDFVRLIGGPFENLILYSRVSSRIPSPTTTAL
jgi:hypothetical protein